MTKTRRAGAARGLALGMMLAALSAGPAAAGHAFPIGAIYTSPEAIGEAQAILARIDLLQPGTYTKGDLDQPTIDALRRFQRSHFLRPSGRLDPETMGLLSSHAGGPAKSESAMPAAPAEAPPTPAAPTRGKGALVGSARTPRAGGEPVAAIRTLPETGSVHATRTGSERPLVETRAGS